MIKFNLQTSERDGFKLSSQADNPEEIKVLQELTKALINKIEKIVVEIRPPEY